MKNLLFLFSFILVASLSANAQCSKSASAGKACCAAKKTASVSSSDNQTKVASVVMEADEAMKASKGAITVSYTHLRAHETVLDLVCRLLLEKKKIHEPTTTLQYNLTNTMVTSK